MNAVISCCTKLYSVLYSILYSLSNLSIGHSKTPCDFIHFSDTTSKEKYEYLVSSL